MKIVLCTYNNYTVECLSNVFPWVEVVKIAAVNKSRVVGYACSRGIPLIATVCDCCSTSTEGIYLLNLMLIE